MRALFTHPDTVMLRMPLLILMSRQRASAGRVCLSFAIEGLGSV